MRILYRWLFAICFSLLAAGNAAAAAAIDMPLTDINGNKLNLSSYHGKWVVVNYWATWCPPCIVEMPELQSFHDEHAAKGALVIGINVEHIGRQRLHGAGYRRKRNGKKYSLADDDFGVVGT